MSRRRLMLKGKGTEPDKGWEDGVKYQWAVGLVPNTYILRENGNTAAYNGWSATDFLPCHGAKRLVHGEFMNQYNAFYDENKNFIRSFSLGSEVNSANVPTNAYYFRISDASNKFTNLNRWYVIPYSE